MSRCERCDREECQREAMAKAATGGAKWSTVEELESYRAAKVRRWIAESDCDDNAVDWRARALAAEQRTAEVERVAKQVAVALDYAVNGLDTDSMEDGARAVRMVDAALAAYRAACPDIDGAPNGQ